MLVAVILMCLPLFWYVILPIYRGMVARDADVGEWTPREDHDGD